MFSQRETGAWEIFSKVSTCCSTVGLKRESFSYITIIYILLVFKKILNELHINVFLVVYCDSFSNAKGIYAANVHSKPVSLYLLIK